MPRLHPPIDDRTLLIVYFETRNPKLLRDTMSNSSTSARAPTLLRRTISAKALAFPHTYPKA